MSQAAAILDAFSGAECIALFAALYSRSSPWLLACTRMLSQVAAAKRATQILSLPSQSADPAMAYHALDGLRYMS